MATGPGELLPVQSAGSIDGTRVHMSVAWLLLLPKCNETIEGKTHRWLADPKPLRLVFYGRELSRLSLSRGYVALRLFQLAEPSQVGVVVGWLVGLGDVEPTGLPVGSCFLSAIRAPANTPLRFRGPALCACVGQTPSYSVTADEGFVEHGRRRYPVRAGPRFVPPDFSGTKSTSGERFSCKCLLIHSASVAQLDRASDYGSEGFRFDS